MAKPVDNFLNHMAFKVDFDSVKPSKETEQVKAPAVSYEPMRRKLQIPRN